jgi:hypothetical protein
VFQRRSAPASSRNALGPADGHEDDHSAFPAHAHLNLLGFVARFYSASSVEASRLALPQVWIWIVSTVALAVGVGLVHTGHVVGEPIVAVDSFTIFADAILFTWLVFQASPKALRRKIEPSSHYHVGEI